MCITQAEGIFLKMLLDAIVPGAIRAVRGCDTLGEGKDKVKSFWQKGAKDSADLQPQYRPSESVPLVTKAVSRSTRVVRNTSWLCTGKCDYVE